MNRVQSIIKVAAVLSVAAALLALVSCKDSRPAAPVVTLTEVGHDNSHTATVGDDMHLEADIVAEGLTKAIYVELHLEEGDYEIETSYTEGKYINVRNTTFHEHIDIPNDAPAGEYHLHFVVTDQEGQQTQATAHVNVVSDKKI